MKTPHLSLKTNSRTLARWLIPTGSLGVWRMVASCLLAMVVSLSSQEATKEVASPEGTPKNGAPKEAAAESTPAAKPKKTASLSFENQDLRQILPSMAKQAGMNLILPEDVKGTVTARLADLDMRQAMEAILESKGYQLVERKGVYTVKSKDSLNQDPTVKQVYTFSYATAKDLKPTADKLLSKASGANVQLDDRSNSLVITDVQTSLDDISKILKRLDTETPQVLIETKLMEMTRNPQEAIGINWSSLNGYTVTLASPLNSQVPGSINSQRINFGISRSGDPGSTGAANAGRRGGVISPMSAAGYPFAAVLDMPAFSATMSFLLQDSDTELLGCPKVITADNKEAIIKIAQQEPIPNFTFNQQTASFVISGFEYKDVGNTLKVTPHVNQDKFITLDVEPQVSTAAAGGRVFALGTGGSITIPLISVRTLTSRVMVKSGNTLALGGLLSSQATRSYSKVPFFGDIPLFGELFHNRSYAKTKQNLLMFITPTVISSETGSGLEDQYAQLKETDMNDRFAYRKSFMGNAKPRDQFRKEQEPSGLPRTSTTADTNYEEKTKALEQAADLEKKTPDVNPAQLAPHLAPSLRQ